jgi:hypothetical protein
MKVIAAIFLSILAFWLGYNLSSDYILDDRRAMCVKVK